MVYLRPQRLAFVWILCSFATAAFSQAPSTELPPRVRTALQDFARQVDPISIEYSYRIRPLIPSEQIETALDLDDWLQQAYFAPRKCRVSVRDHLRYSDSTWDVAPEHRIKRRSESAFDGTWRYTGSNRSVDAASNPTAVLHRTHIDHLLATQGEQDLGTDAYLLAIGLRDAETWKERATKPRMASAILKYLDAECGVISVRDEQIDNVKTLRIEIEIVDPHVRAAKARDLDEMKENLEHTRQMLAQANPNSNRARELRMKETGDRRSIDVTERLCERPELKRLIWFLDEARGFAVMRYEECSPDGSILVATTSSDFTQREGRSIWLPRKVVEQRYCDFVGSRTFAKPVLEIEMNLSAIDYAALDVASFSLRYDKPGSRICTHAADGEYSEREIPTADSPSTRER